MGMAEIWSINQYPPLFLYKQKINPICLHDANHNQLKEEGVLMKVAVISFSSQWVNEVVLSSWACFLSVFRVIETIG